MQQTIELNQAVAAILIQKNWLLATAESCTGGLIAATCTDLAGSSVWFERGFVTYSNAAKAELLGVPPELIAIHGAVSEPVARAMASGALAHSPAQVAVAVTGIAGPSGGSADKPVGTVWVAWAWPQLGIGTGCSGSAPVAMQVDATGHRFPGDRAAVRAATVKVALAGLLARLQRTAR
jgi:nicotinamide-nucleotide amidase